MSKKYPDNPQELYDMVNSQSSRCPEGGRFWCSKGLSCPQASIRI